MLKQSIFVIDFVVIVDVVVINCFNIVFLPFNLVR